MVVLSGDVVLIILDSLKAEVYNHDTLFQCALASRWLAEPALSILYQLYDSCPVFGGGLEYEIAGPRHDSSSRASSKSAAIFRKWTLMWQSIILSTSEGKTYLPYCDYIRYLDLDDLRDLLTHSEFTGPIRDEFFAGELGDLIYQFKIKTRKRLRYSQNFTDTNWVVQRVGTLITERAHMIRELRGNIPGSSLQQWVVHLPKLDTLDLWNGGSFTKKASEAIGEHCPNIKSLLIFRWLDNKDIKADIEAEHLVNCLRRNTLETFEITSYSFLGARTIQALGTHLDSLTKLTLTNLSFEAIVQLSSLPIPKALSKLVLIDSQHSQIPTDSDSWRETVLAFSEWISQCQTLRHVHLRDFMGTEDTKILTDVLISEKIRLESLQVRCYLSKNNTGFHDALPVQSESLRVLILEGRGTNTMQNETSLVLALCQMTELRELDLHEVSESYSTSHVLTILAYLKKLEGFSVNGVAFDDSLWPAFLSLRRLRSLAIHAFSEFTAEGILDFVSQLTPDNNKGFHLSITSADADTAISPEAQNVISEALEANVGGVFDYAVITESELSDDSVLSD